MIFNNCILDYTQQRTNNIDILHNVEIINSRVNLNAPTQFNFIDIDHIVIVDNYFDKHEFKFMCTRVKNINISLRYRYSDYIFKLFISSSIYNSIKYDVEDLKLDKMILKNVISLIVTPTQFVLNCEAVFYSTDSMDQDLYILHIDELEEACIQLNTILQPHIELSNCIVSGLHMAGYTTIILNRCILLYNDAVTISNCCTVTIDMHIVLDNVIPNIQNIVIHLDNITRSELTTNTTLILTASNCQQIYFKGDYKYLSIDNNHLEEFKYNSQFTLASIVYNKHILEISNVDNIGYIDNTGILLQHTLLNISSCDLQHNKISDKGYTYDSKISYLLGIRINNLPIKELYVADSNIVHIYDLANILRLHCIRIRSMKLNMLPKLKYLSAHLSSIVYISNTTD
jgi:hypothetical protein